MLVGRRLVDRHRRAVAGVVAGPTSAGRRTTASWSCSSATTASAASPATRPAASAGAAPAAAPAACGAPTGITRLFNSSFGGQISWLLPAALILLVAGCWCSPSGPAHRPHPRRPACSGAAGCVVTGLTISLGQGIIHEYYTVALAPAIGALVGIGVVELWRRRTSPYAAGALALTSFATVLWSTVLLGRSADWMPWLRPTVLVVGLIATLGVGLIWILPRNWALAAVIVAGAAGLAGATAYTLETVSTPHTGAIPTAGPTVVGNFGGFGGGGFPGGGQLPTGGQLPNGGQLPTDGQLPTGGQLPNGASCRPATRSRPAQREGSPAERVAPVGCSGPVSRATSSSSVLSEDTDSYTWIAATTGANSAAGYQLATGDPVMSLGGFNGSDPYPTLDQFQQYVADGEVHWYIAGGGMGGGAQMGGSSATSEIQSWVEDTFTATTVDGVTLYDLTQPT